MPNHRTRRVTSRHVSLRPALCVVVVWSTSVSASTLAIVDPIEELVDAITGPIAVALGLLVLVGMGISYGMGRSDFQEWARNSAVTVLFLAVVFLARPFLRDLFGTPAAPAGALLGF